MHPNTNVSIHKVVNQCSHVNVSIHKIIFITVVVIFHEVKNGVTTIKCENNLS